MDIRASYLAKFKQFTDESTATSIESSCYTYTKKKYVAQDRPPLKSWDDSTFKGIYDSKCGFLISILMQTKISPEVLSRKDIANLKLSQLCPELISDDEIIIKKRNEQKIELKTSMIYRCPYCGEYKSQFIEKGTRGSDEAKEILCFCTSCKKSYRGN